MKVDTKTHTIIVHGRKTMKVYVPLRNEDCLTGDSGITIKDKEILHFSKVSGSEITLKKVQTIPSEYKSYPVVDISSAANPGIILGFIKIKGFGENCIPLGEDVVRDPIKDGTGINLNVQDLYVELLDETLIYHFEKDTDTSFTVTCPVDSKKILYKINSKCKIQKFCK